MSRLLIPYLFLPLAGFVLGWWIRGGPAEAEASGGQGSGESQPVRREGGASGENGSLPAKRLDRRSGDEFSEADRRREIADRAQMEDAARRKLERQVAEWARELDLEAGQVLKLREAIDPALGAVEPPLAELVLPALVAVLESLLDGGGLSAFQQLGIRKAEAVTAAKVEAKLAEMGAVLLLTPDQTEALRASLAEDPERLPDPSRRPDPGLSPEAMAEISRRLASRNDDGSGFMTVAGEVVRETIEADLQGLSPILTADQMEAYRDHLEEIHGQWLRVSP
jgi:hypothetical protein